MDRQEVEDLRAAVSDFNVKEIELLAEDGSPLNLYGFDAYKHASTQFDQLHRAHLQHIKADAAEVEKAERQIGELAAKIELLEQNIMAWNAVPATREDSFKKWVGSAVGAVDDSLTLAQAMNEGEGFAHGGLTSANILENTTRIQTALKEALGKAMLPLIAEATQGWARGATEAA